MCRVRRSRARGALSTVSRLANCEFGATSFPFPFSNVVQFSTPRGEGGRDVWDERIHTCTVVVEMCSYLAVFSMHTSNANTRIAHYTPAAPIVLLPPVRSSSPLPSSHYNRLRPMIFAFLWITFTMVHELFLILHRHRPEKFISNNNLITKSMEIIFYWTNVEWFFFF